jgi:hypothetical protein
VGYSPTAVTYGEEEEEDMSFRDRARQRLQERAQPASEDDQEQQGDQPEAQPAASAPTQPAASAPAQPDYTAELEQLARLKEQGILTEEEFTAKKKQILGI